MVDRIELALASGEKQIVFIDGEAGTGKTVLNSSIFYELFCRADRKNTKFNSYMVVNHKEQVKVYTDIYRKLGIEEECGEVVSKASRFINKHPDDNSLDVVFIDEAHLLFTQGNQGYSGKNQLDDIVKRAKVTVIVFDENQILRMDQYWESQMIDKYRNKAIAQNNHFTLTEQLRMKADKETLNWIDDFTKKQKIGKIPHGSYDIKIFDSPFDLEVEINRKANVEDTKLSRLIANYDWDYSDNKSPEDRYKKYWEVVVGKWHKPWNYQLKGKIEFLPSESSNDKVNKKRTMSDGTMQNFGEELLKHEIRVLMTRGVNGMYIYACDPELRKALLDAAK